MNVQGHLRLNSEFEARGALKKEEWREEDKGWEEREGGKNEEEEGRRKRKRNAGIQLRVLNTRKERRED